MSSLQKFSRAPESGITPAALTQMQYFHIFSFLDANKGHNNVRNVIYEMIKIEFTEKYVYIFRRGEEKIVKFQSTHTSISIHFTFFFFCFFF